jgi:hypothetical protein
MSYRTIKQVTILGLVGAIVAGAGPGAGRAANIVDPGWDLFQTDAAGTTFGGVNFGGVPLGTFDFGGSIGVQNVGGTDTIVHRSDPVSEPSGSTPIEMLALQLKSVVPVDFGLGTDFYYITLQSARGGPATVGRMTINFDSPPPPALTDKQGTFSSFFDVFFDIRKGALDGPIAVSDSLELTNSGASWAHQQIPAPLEIPGVNTFLNGQDRSADFFPLGLVQEVHPTGAMHSVQTTPIPEPSTLVLIGLGCGGLVGSSWLRRRAA